MEGRWNYPVKTGVWLFMIGAIIGASLYIAAFIQDYEAVIFSATVSGDDTLRSLTCPELITNHEVGIIRAKISNQTDKRLFRHVRANISQGYLTFKRVLNDSFYMEPGETRDLSWEVYPTDAAWGYVVMVKVYIFKSNPIPSKVGACGVTVLDIPFLKGWQVITLVASLSITLMGVGYRRFTKANQPLVRKKGKLARNLRVIAVTVILGIASMALELFYIELIFFVFTIILLAESAFEFSRID